jgi:hypothetical protein
MSKEYLISKIVEMTRQVVSFKTLNRYILFVQRLYKKESG